MPPTEDDEDGADKGEGNDENGEDEPSQILSSQVLTNNLDMLGVNKKISKFGGEDYTELYKPDNLLEINDRLQGVTPSHYANVA